MKAHQLVCLSMLLLRSSPAAQVSRAISVLSNQQGLSCPRPSFPWFKVNWKLAKCQSHHYTMADLEFDYARHYVCCFKDVPAGKETMDVIVAGTRHEAAEHIIFFGGDVQDYPENMQSHRDNGKYVHWNTLSTAGRLCERFPTAMVLVMKPCRMHLKTFSVYSQFVQSNDFGCPTHTPDFGAWQMLVTVYEEAVRRALAPAPDTALDNSDHHSIDGEHYDKCATEKNNSIFTQNNDEQSKQTVAEGSGAPVPKVPVHLIGFSKGCVVLNQLVHELEAVQGDDAVQNFLSRIQFMTWLDGGHSGGNNTWVTDQVALGHLAALSINISVHVTPYQVKDPMRRWIGKEKQKFVELLRKAGAKVTDQSHFEDEPRSIENHFRVLENF